MPRDHSSSAFLNVETSLTGRRWIGPDPDQDRLSQAMAQETGLPVREAERHVHDVLNVFMCTGFTPDEGRYFMKASPVRPGDALELFAEIDLLGALSACPGGDCGTVHSSDAARCHPLKVEIWEPDRAILADWQPPAPNAYDGSHGT